MEDRNGLEERDNEDWTEASTGNLGCIKGDGETTGDTSEPMVHQTEATNRIGENGNSEQQSAIGDRGAEGNMGRANNSGNEEVGEREREGVRGFCTITWGRGS